MVVPERDPVVVAMVDLKIRVRWQRWCGLLVHQELLEG
ncbi:hypothetical protein BLL52_1925 [Rhodoferax antarcticus ANT.BR]|uniref:Uncharacterized protein n=1 Tax=Rhodoferax antarcticus ANT.BR TaxID=1111071 RepID=A0A1Q8YCS4_9BURK|nr:hypothetical protein BLL52_1925 [Rhodoferax antarcticus ANT.BR]